jgi:hypothetical protein
MGICPFFQPWLKLGARGIFPEVSPTKRLYASTVTGVCPSQNPLLIVT